VNRVGCFGHGQARTPALPGPWGLARAPLACRNSLQFLLLTVNTVAMYSSPAMHPVERERGKKYVGLPEFARVSEQVLSELGIEQKRGTVSLVPDERTIRYYLAEGLIQPADEKQGTASVFSYKHLLQLVAVKKLQAEHLPIRKIRELVTDKDEQQLKTLLGVTAFARKGTDDKEAKRYLESLLAPSMLFGGIQSAPQETAPSSSAAEPPRRESSVSWQRVEIEPGLELHIRSDYKPAVAARTKGLTERIRTAISRYWRERQ
jgi:DNA-binding transcriptional MerR regulator